jgi:type IV fimbrial biogenesis protein FimT
MIVMVIVAIGVSLAVPSIRSVIEKRQLTRAAETVAAFMTLAQSAAVKYDRDINLNIQRTGVKSWCVGATLGASACDCTEADTTAADFCQINGVPRRIVHTDVVSNSNYELMQSILVNGTATASANIIFDPVRGTLLNLQTIEFQMHTNTGTGSDKEYQVNVDVLPTGRVKLCTATGKKLLLKSLPTCT